MTIAPHPADTAQEVLDLTLAPDAPEDYPCEGPGPCRWGASWEVLVHGIDPEDQEVTEVMRPLCHTHYARAVEWLSLWRVHFMVRRV